MGKNEDERERRNALLISSPWMRLACTIHTFGPFITLVPHIPPLSSPRSHIYDLVCLFREHFSPVLSPEKSYGLLVRFPRHFSELLLPLDLSETFTLSIYLVSVVLSLSRMISFREIESCLRILMLSKLIFDNITPPLKTYLSSTMNIRG